MWFRNKKVIKALRLFETYGIVLLKTIDDLEDIEFYLIFNFFGFVL